MSLTTTALFESPGGHRNLLLPDHAAGDAAVQANQHLIVHAGHGAILDPGGHKVYNRALAETLAQLGGGRLDTIFLSHQDPDVVAALNGWLMATEATAYVSRLWLRFIPHFGIDSLVVERLVGLPDEGALLELGGCSLMALPAHFLHSEGNFQFYDPVAKILFSGDLGASLMPPKICGQPVPDFARHIPNMEGFHRRYMVSNKVCRLWARMVRQLDIEMIVPQHGPFFKGKAMCNQFIDWIDNLSCGVDLVSEANYMLPQSRV